MDATTTFESAFFGKCGAWANNQSVYGSSYGALGVLDWIGDVGAYVNKDGAHGVGRALDITAAGHANGFVDSNWSWRQGGSTDVRKYLGTAALCRREVGNVLTRWFNTAHHDHIHIDDYRAAGPVDTTKQVDTTIVQAACNHLNNAGLVIDGAWGTATENAYVALLDQFNMKCLDPKTNASHARTFFGYIAAHCFKDQNAGYYQYSC